MGSGCCRFRSSPARPVAATSPASAAITTQSERPRQRNSDMDDLRESLQDFIGNKNFSKLVRAKVFLVKPWKKCRK